MVRKIDRDDPAIPDSDAPVAGIHSEDFFDEVTAAVAGKIEVVDSEDHSGELFTDDTGPVRVLSASLTSKDDDALEPGFILRDRFEIVTLVHSSGMGHVYKAIDRHWHQNGSDQIHVAIKMMRRSVGPEPVTGLTLAREAAKAQRLSHPNIVNIYDFDRHDDRFFLVMEWLQGESVNELLRRTSGRLLAPQFSWQIIQGIASGLQHAHANDVIHADINPSNIFITDTQQIKLLDFGVARYGSDPEDSIAERFAWATRRYASPEVLSEKTPEFEDDIFSLGCVAYRLLSGHHPFAGRSSIEAKEAGVALQPVPGLSETQWQTLSRALAYERADRPTTLSVFFGELPDSNKAGRVHRIVGRRPANWVLVTSAAAITLLAGVLWLSQSGGPNQPAVSSEPLPVDGSASTDIGATIEPTELDTILNSAAQAMEEERFITPEGNNARDLYRDTLQLDAANSAALSGLRAISDIYVQQANTALRSGAPTQAVAALSIATETDPENPAIAVVNDLLLAQGNAQLANARLAAAEGDADRATLLLSMAERYPSVDLNEIDAVRNQLAQSADERQFLRRLATADEHLAAGRLIAPIGNNAYAVMIELYQDHNADLRFLTSLERLGERLLTRAAFASAADRIPEATEYLDAADTLGVLTAEVAAAREALQSAVEELPMPTPAPVESAPPTNAAATISPRELDDASTMTFAAEEQASVSDSTQALSRVASAQSATPPMTPVRESEVASLMDNAVGEPASVPDSTDNVPRNRPAAAAGSGAMLTEEPSQPRLLTLSDLDIETYVAPNFPRRALRRGLTGSVELTFSVFTDGSTGDLEIVNAEPGELFIRSAEDAVRQWRFAPAEDVVRARVKLRFEQDAR